jgi:hypothetical protein
MLTRRGVFTLMFGVLMIGASSAASAQPIPVVAEVAA